VTVARSDANKARPLAGKDAIEKAVVSKDAANRQASRSQDCLASLAMTWAGAIWTRDTMTDAHISSDAAKPILAGATP